MATAHLLNTVDKAILLCSIPSFWQDSHNLGGHDCVWELLMLLGVLKGTPYEMLCLESRVSFYYSAQLLQPISALLLMTTNCCSCTLWDCRCGLQAHLAECQNFAVICRALLYFGEQKGAAFCRAKPASPGPACQMPVCC